MIKIIKIVSLMFILTACGTAPITDLPAHAFELEIERGQWDRVYHAIEYLKRGQVKRSETKASDTINNALTEFYNGSNDTTEQKELLQLQSDGD
tara:strand:+ start:1463 stop:1744 length:282 start_codon:yes stop_codon:yes gene_type:complete